MIPPRRIKCDFFCAFLLFLLVHSVAVPAKATQEATPVEAAQAETAPVEAAQAEGKQEKPLVYSTPHANILALSFAYQAPLSLEKSLPWGGGITYTHEYFVTRRTALGVHVGVRFFPSAPWQLAIGYGLTFKHYVTSLKPTGPTTGLYLLYGLLLQMNYVKDREGTATGHDTRLAIGYDWRAGVVMPTLELGYHLTQVRNFDEDTLWWPYTELVAGIRF